MSRHSFDTLLLGMRLSPMARAKSSILPIDSSYSWMTAAIAFSALRHGSRKPGHSVSCRNFSAPRRVFSLWSR
jgi:hypothetical protein